MYDRYGRYVAKYHKYNLFNSEFSLFNIDKKEQNIYVDTDFGKLLLLAWLQSLNKLRYMLIIEKQLTAQYVEHIYILGRLGLIICEDLLWYYPTVDLVASNEVDTIIFPTEWWDEYPHQLPHVDQASWAKALQVYQAI